jgi:hypothetical protein
MDKEKMLLVRIPESDVEQTLQDAIENSEVERGLFKKTDIGKLLFNEMKKLKERGYFPVGFVFEDGNNIEFLFQRHPRQTKEMKLVEGKVPKNRLYKL